MELVVRGNILENVNAFVIDLHNLIACPESPASAAGVPAFTAPITGLSTPTKQMIDKMTPIKARIKLNTGPAAMTENPAPRRFAVEASL